MNNPTIQITIQTTVTAPIEEVWKCWISPVDIAQWNNPSDDWHSPRVENDLREGGRFFYRMETKNGSEGFDHSGMYDKITHHELIEYTGSDGRKSIIRFIANGNETIVHEIFEPAAEPSLEIQKHFCQSVLNNFKRHTESQIK